MHPNAPHRPSRRRFVCVLVALLGALALAAPAAAHHLEASVSVPIRTLSGFGAKPDLYLLFPTVSASYQGTVPAVFVDAYEIPDGVVYRFDTVIANAGGTLDFYSADGGKTLLQVLWPGGRPPANNQPTPLSAPNDPSHATQLAGAKFVRMGISPGVGDYYAAQLTDQWIDVTGLAPREYVLRGVVNPGGRLIETDASNNTLEVLRTIPGATAAGLAQSVPRNQSTALGLSGTVVGPEIHAFAGWKKTATKEKCALRFGECYVTAQPDTLSFQLVAAPAHGSVVFDSSAGTTTTATYTPDPGYEGADSFGYTTTDTRRLSSAVATVHLGVGDIPVSIAAPAVTGTTAIGSALDVLPGSWIAPEGAELQFDYAWQRCSSGKSARCAGIAGAKRRTYRVSKADLGKRLRVVVTARNAAARGTAKSRRGDRITRFATLLGTQFDDKLLGGRASERIEGRRGSDIIKGGRGNDIIFGGPGVDKLRGGSGNDRIVSVDGRIDVVTCGGGIDTVVADRKDRVAGSCENVRRS